MTPAPTSFGVRETHGILWRSENAIRAASDGRGWTSLYASAQRELPYEGLFPAVRDQLVVLHLDGPVAIDRSPRGNAVRYLVPAGGVHLVPGGEEFGVRLNGVLETLHVYVRRAVIEEVAAEMIEGDPAALEIPARIRDADPALRPLLAAVEGALQEDDAAGALLADCLARAIAVRLVRDYAACRLRPPAPAPVPGGDRPPVARAIEFMRAHLDRSLDLAEIAAAAGRSPSHVARQFRAETGLAPHRYLVRLRLARAKEMLAGTAEPIAEIAAACGFSHQEHLTRLLKRDCGATPAAYRRQRRS